MKFSDLDTDAKEVAVNDYIEGWKVTHPDEELSNEEAEELCYDSEDDVEYEENGVIKDDIYS